MCPEDRPLLISVACPLCDAWASRCSSCVTWSRRCSQHWHGFLDLLHGLRRCGFLRLGAILICFTAVRYRCLSAVAWSSMICLRFLRRLRLRVVGFSAHRFLVLRFVGLWSLFASSCRSSLSWFRAALWLGGLVLCSLFCRSFFCFHFIYTGPPLGNHPR